MLLELIGTLEWAESSRTSDQDQLSILANDWPSTIRAHWESVRWLAPLRNYHISRLVEPKNAEDIGLSVHTVFLKIVIDGSNYCDGSKHGLISGNGGYRVNGTLCGMLGKKTELLLQKKFKPSSVSSINSTPLSFLHMLLSLF